MAVWLAAGLSAVFGGKETSGGSAAFALREVSGFGVGYGGHFACQSEPDPNTIYPSFSSTKPLYGEVRIDMEFGSGQSGVPYRFAMDESGGTDAGYDRLYLDLDRDGKLAEEKPLEPMKDPPAVMLNKGDWIAHLLCFDTVDLRGQGTGFVQVLPRLTIDKKGYTSLSLFPTEARRGEIEIAGHRFDVVMHNSTPVGTRWDRPETVLKMTPQDPNMHGPAWPYFGGRLLGWHKIGEDYWRLSTTPAGDQLFVEPYRGSFGTFTVGSARRYAWSRKFVGELLAKDRAVVVRKEPAEDDHEPVQTCEIPAGDYTPGDLAVYYGPLYFVIVGNRYVDGKPYGSRPMTYPLKIREREPCVLRFSKRAEVLFASPAKETRIKPGDELTVEAVLIDPKLDIVIEDLRRMPQEDKPRYVLPLLGAVVSIPLLAWLLDARSRRYRFLPLLSLVGLVLLGSVLGMQHIANSASYRKAFGLESYDRLNSGVTIYRANGEMVAGDVIPLGREYSWRVPEDLKLDGDQETFTIQVTYETHELYGTVTGTREFTVSKGQ